VQRIRVVALVGLSVAVLTLAIYWSYRPGGFATPADCVEAYGEAVKTGDIPKYLSCLGEPLRSQVQSQFVDAAELADVLRRSMKDVKSWTQILDSTTQDSDTVIPVDVVRATGTVRVRFRLERFGKHWLIVGMDQPLEMPMPIPYGTHISKEVERPPSEEKP
jgi:hypothetical protein